MKPTKNSHDCKSSCGAGLLVSSAAFADPVGRYWIQGTNPGNAKPYPGLALHGKKPDGSWHGIWTYAGGRRIGTDRWTPR